MLFSSVQHTALTQLFPRCLRLLLWELLLLFPTPCASLPNAPSSVQCCN